MRTSRHVHAVTRLGAPAAVIGTLAAVLTVAPADAEEPRPLAAETGPLLRLLSPADAPLRTTTATPGAVRPSSTPAMTYTVKSGDTVYAIAQRHALKTTDVLAWNRLSWSSIIHPGQKLRLTPPNAPRQDKPDTSQKQTSDTRPTATHHTVVRGDTVYGIAKKYGTTVASIISWNRLSPAALIHPGQKLRVSAAVTTTTSTDSKPENDKPENDKRTAATHTVVAGDTLFGIARKYALSVDFLLRANGLRDGSIIYPGQVLRLTAPASTQRSATLDATQKANAIRIVRIGRELGVSDHGIAIALATAMVESSMRNLNHGDRDSLGLFQQRPSQGWGTAKQIMNADRSIRVFYGGAHDPNGTKTRGLLDIRGWQAMAFTDAAQAVQVSAYPDRYGQWEQQARRWVATLR